LGLRAAHAEVLAHRLAEDLYFVVELSIPFLKFRFQIHGRMANSNSADGGPDCGPIGLGMRLPDPMERFGIGTSPAQIRR
jgi:hypothetical protein